MAEGLDAPEPATVVAATVWRDNDGTAAGAPVIARLADGRQMAVSPADDEVRGGHGRPPTSPASIGGSVVVQAGEPRYRLAER